MAVSKKLAKSKINTFLLNEKVNKKILLELKSSGNLSEAELKFLSLSKEKEGSSEVIKKIVNSEITLENYEPLFSLKGYKSVGGTINPEQSVRNVRYQDKKGNFVAIVQIDTINKKIRMQNFGDIFPKQEVCLPSQVSAKLKNLANYNNWIIEDGGINQFNGNSEFRYKDLDGNVMATVITKPDETIDMIVEYSYIKGYKSQMLLTNQFGQSLVIYDGTKKCIQQSRIDIDTDGMIVEITKAYY